ncbi:MAG: lipoprotein insertase outer membrane protein LolB [Pseudomonadales bacterium]|nr:lipoprotein insertase outer membrane protein LolB [Pseudomonadales bacterium]
MPFSGSALKTDAAPMPSVSCCLSCPASPSLSPAHTPRGRSSLPVRVQLFRLCCGLLLMAFLSACATQATTPVSGLSWQQHQRALLALESWDLQGRLNIRSSSESSTVTINWAQTADDYVISLSGAFGAGAVKISGNPQGATLEKAGEETVYADSLENIAALYLAYEFPAKQLYYWIRGLPAPETGGKTTLSPEQRLASLRQDGWELSYDRYQATAGYFLPGRIRLDHTPYRLTFLINTWRLPQADPGAH